MGLHRAFVEGIPIQEVLSSAQIGTKEQPIRRLRCQHQLLCVNIASETIQTVLLGAVFWRHCNKGSRIKEGHRIL